MEIAETGSLEIDGEYYYSEGIKLLGGNIFNYGEIRLNNLDKDVTKNIIDTVDSLRRDFIDDLRYSNKTTNDLIATF